MTDQNSRIHPIAGRVLGLMARAHFSVGELMTSEGLFRNALDKMKKSPYTTHDIRCGADNCVFVYSIMAYYNMMMIRYFNI